MDIYSRQGDQGTLLAAKKRKKEKILCEGGGVEKKKRKEKSQGGIWGSWNALFSQAVSAGIRLVWFVGNSTHLISV